MAIELKLEDKPWYYALGWGLGIAIILAGAVHYAWFRGLNAQIKTKRADLETLHQEIQKGLAAERKLPQFREEVRRLELELAKLLQVLPSKRNTEELIKRIETLTRQGDFTLRKFTPGDFVAKEFYSEWPIDIQLDGTYHNLALFFDRMSRFSRIINVEDLKVTALEGVPQKSIGAVFVAKTFIYTGEEQAAPVEGEAGAAPGTAPPPAASSAQKLKERAEGRGVE
ncbi:MAG TPA: type 4a pilus biogenesis protein PilO [Thermoanaerobaculia bacterium]|nr:type 4a pilus biogenesis protein PilO [Thermoanaerobaculia bacterium]